MTKSKIQTFEVHWVRLPGPEQVLRAQLLLFGWSAENIRQAVRRLKEAATPADASTKAKPEQKGKKRGGKRVGRTLRD